jgi:hypothetical protein
MWRWLMFSVTAIAVQVAAQCEPIPIISYKPHGVWMVTPENAYAFFSGGNPEQKEPPEVTIDRLTIRSGEPKTEIVAIEKSFSGTSFPADRVVDELGQQVRFAFEDRGYFLALIGDPEIKYTSGGPSKAHVMATVSADIGDQFRLGDRRFAGGCPGPPTLRAAEQEAAQEVPSCLQDQRYSVAPLPQLRSAFELHDGDFFSRRKIGEGLERLQKLYVDHGYINFHAGPDDERRPAGADDHAQR